MATTFTAGQKLSAADLNNALGLGIVARGQRTSSSTGTTGTSQTSAQGVMRLSASLTSGRLYRIEAPSFGVFSGSAATIGVQLTYTTNGTTPTAGSTVLKFSQRQVPTASEVQAVTLAGIYVPGSNITFQVLLSLWRVSGSGTCQVFGSTTWPLDMLITDLGVDTGDVGVDI